MTRLITVTTTTETKMARKPRATALEVLETLKSKKSRLESKLDTLNGKISQIESRFRNKIVVEQMRQNMTTEDIERELEATRERARLLREVRKQVTTSNV